ncbi:hypothetical protein FB451DRAFT_366193 [Mycena latifolia]|nr:hypothetical protein FB451DRAFT_366193 [Mycena latifolia]
MATALTQNGVVLGTRPPDAAVDGYRACSVAFFPSAKYMGPAHHETHASRLYHFLEDPEKPAIFTDTAGARSGTLNMEDPVVTTHSSAVSLSHAVFTWCKRVHDHPTDPTRGPLNRTEKQCLVSDIITWEASPQSSGNNNTRRRKHFRAARSSGATTSTPQAALPRTAAMPRTATGGVRVKLLSLPAHQGQSLAESLPSKLTAMPSVPAASSAVTRGVTAWFVLPDGEVFDDPAEAEAVMKLKGLSKVKIVSTLDDARTWYLGKGQSVAL